MGGGSHDTEAEQSVNRVMHLWCISVGHSGSLVKNLIGFV